VDVFALAVWFEAPQGISGVGSFGSRRQASQSALDAERLAQCELLRDVFGDLRRRASRGPLWLTPSVTSLAQAAYEERALPSGELEPARLAILADALEEATCSDDALLAHLRGPGPHVRGCWAVDLVLGRS
jgi:hypothetical protein